MKKNYCWSRLSLVAFFIYAFIGSACFADQLKPTEKSFPLSQLGQKATEKATSSTLGIKAVDNGAEITCKLQALEALVTPTGVSIKSTSKAEGSGAFSMNVAGIGRAGKILPVASQNDSVSVSENCARILHTGLTEEFTVSGDGIRQDFVISKIPDGIGKLELALVLSGAKPQIINNGLKIRFDDTGRELVYSKLMVTDSTGRKLPSVFKTGAPDNFSINVDDMNAVYPIMIDPTISDANWVSMGGNFNGTDSSLNAITLDSSGNLYVGGSFTIAGDVTANNIAKWNGSTWSILGTGMDSTVSALAIDQSGSLYAGGYFTTAGGISANYIAKWDGSTWSALGSGTDGGVNALAFDSSGNLYAGVYFTTTDGVPVNRIAKWDGSTWSTLGTGMDSTVFSLATDQSGNLYAGGSFTAAGGVTVNKIAKWNGSIWSALGSGMSGNVYSVVCDSSGNLYAGGGFITADGVSANNIAKWNGSTWSSLGSGMNDGVCALTCDSSGNIYAGGGFTTAGGVTANSIAKWNGSIWSSLGSGMNSDGVVLSLVTDQSGNLYAGGGLTTAGGVVVDNIARWNGSSWGRLGDYNKGIDGYVTALAADSGGNIYIGGEFTTAGGVPVNSIAKWNGTSWCALDSGVLLDESYGYIYALTCDASGNLYAGGIFNNAGGMPVNSIAKWNGTSWSALGSGVLTDPFYLENGPGIIYALTCDSSGNLYACGMFAGAGEVFANNIAKWDGLKWSGLGNGLDGEVLGLTLDSDENLYAWGSITDFIGEPWHIAKWDGSTWREMGTRPVYTYISQIFSVAFDSFGNLYAVSDIGILKWDGSSWSVFPSIGNSLMGVIYALTFDSSGNLYVGGEFYKPEDGEPFYIAKWDGSAWSSLGSGTDSAVNVLTFDSSGNLYAGGGFFTAGGKTSPFLAKCELSGINTHLITVSCGANGRIYPGTVRVEDGTDKTFSITPNSGYQVAEVLVDDVSVGAVTSYKFTNVTANHTISASFVVDNTLTTVIRSVTGPTVSISVSPPSGTSAWGVEELIPAGLTPTSIGGSNSKWNETTRKITWYSTENAATTLTYKLSGAEGTYNLFGTASFDGVDGTIGGQKSIVIQLNHPADANSDWILVMNEAIGYLSGWQQGKNQMSYAIRGAYLWQNGESYTRQAGKEEPLCWVPETVVSSMDLVSKSSNAALEAVRSIRTAAVKIAVTPPLGTSVWGYEETLPKGLTPVKITGPNCSWNDSTRKITWYTIGAKPSTLGYSVSGSKGKYTVSGLVSFDGANKASTGNSVINYNSTGATQGIKEWWDKLFTELLFSHK